MGLGLGGTETPEARLRKSISNERTFSATDNDALLRQKLGNLFQVFNFLSKGHSLRSHLVDYGL